MQYSLCYRKCNISQEVASVLQVTLSSVTEQPVVTYRCAVYSYTNLLWYLLQRNAQFHRSVTPSAKYSPTDPKVLVTF